MKRVKVEMNERLANMKTCKQFKSSKFTGAGECKAKHSSAPNGEYLERKGQFKDGYQVKGVWQECCYNSKPYTFFVG